MKPEGVVYDLGYTPHEGPRLGRAGAMRAILVDGLRRSLGLRRKPWAKVLPWGLIAAAITPAVFLVGFTFLVSGFSVEDAGPFGDPAQFFDYVGTLLMLFVALVTPTLLVPDRRHGVLSIYASRPIYSSDYLVARAGTVLLLATLFILIPHMILFIGISALNVDGLAAGLRFHADRIPEILGSIVAYVFGYAAPAFLVSLYVKRVAIGTGVYVAVMFMTAALTDALPRQSDLVAFKVLAPFSLFFNPTTVRDWLFDLDGDGMPLVRVDMPQWTAAIAIAVVVVAAAVIARQRYKNEL
ncbi:MAG: hypothetical protein KJO11_02945 [Gemmatimonadetes bacterium]|nr:hypothetical protein [Gemmatimonadota bacterium]MBT8405121.1 hypothetical protein [Gemmatimonadota bacterium]NNK62509.1 hypothetical protein [Gemmatimonadota bacterium]